MLVMIVGAPKTGKTTLAGMLRGVSGFEVIHSDDYMYLPWADQPGVLMSKLKGSDYILEGVAWARCLPRPGLERSSIEPEHVLWIRGPSEEDPKYRGMATQVKRAVEAYKLTHPGRVTEVNRRVKR